MEETRIRKPDGDLRAYLQNNTDIFTLEEIVNMHAEVPGHNDEDNWYWILELQHNRYALTKAWCDYTGWDCQSGGESEIAANREAAALLAPEKERYTGREIRRNLIAQLQGEQPFGMEVVRHAE